MHRLHHTLLVVALSAPSLVASAPAHAAQPRLATRTSVATCTPASLSYTRSTNAVRYAPGEPVIMTTTLRNLTHTRCSIDTGPLSPLFSVSDASGHTLWNNCYTRDEPGPCPQYLVRRVLAPGAAFSAHARWDQRAGVPARQVAPGRYYLTTSVRGVHASGRLGFDIVAARRARTISVNGADTGRTYRLHPGDHLIVHLSASSPYTWSEPVSSSPRVLTRVSGSAGAVTSTTFVARTPGRAVVRASENAICYPQCLPPTRLFSITIHVVS